jgi:hypothetical protein
MGISSSTWYPFFRCARFLTKKDIPCKNNKKNAIGISVFNGNRGSPPGSGDISNTFQELTTAGMETNIIKIVKGKRKNIVPKILM